jgi:hypothetical protein
MLRKARVNQATSRLFEEKLYEIALAEISNESRRAGLWAKALSQAEGNEQKAEGLYLTLRVQSLRDEILLDTTVNEFLKSRKNRHSVPASEVVSSEFKKKEDNQYSSLFSEIAHNWKIHLPFIILIVPVMIIILGALISQN